ncbi:hypothetical protein KIM67_15075 [Flagellimonas sp. 389]|uniref:hypothetical protein n=1 Tax=Flagellimonas sp. 389 TaxID=2835862 RepID=UPI001BD24B49|nr:hypothetical protein [Flagellimonas sp. 389]MBS9463740.1 hypothetical protein [Flagellimonas sp. 389]
MKKLTPIFLLLILTVHLHGQVERDKALHFLGGNLFGLAGAGIAKNASDGNRVWTFMGAVAGGTLIGLAKETVDAGQRENGWDNDDLLATILGGVTVGVAIELFSKKRDKIPKHDSSATHFNLNKLHSSQYDDKLFITEETLPNLTSFGLSSSLINNYRSH